MEETELRFIQLAAVGDKLYGLRKEGDVWLYNRKTALWKPLPMAPEAVGRSAQPPAGRENPRKPT